MQGNPLPDKRNIARNVFLCASIVLILVLPFSILFPHAFRDAQAQRRVVRNYLPIDATVLSSRVNTSTGSKGQIYYEPDIQYQYEVNGTKYHSEKATTFWIDGGEEWADGLVAQYKTGQTCKAYYDPEDPSQAVLIHKYYFQPYRELLQLAFILTTGLFVISQLWFSKKYDPAPVGNGWFEIKPQFGERQKLIVARTCTAAWYGFGAIPAVYFFLSVPPPYSSTAMRDFGIFAVFGLIPVAFLIRYMLMCRNLYEAQVRIDREALHLGQPFNFAISQRTRRQVLAKWFRFQVLCIATTGRGKSRSYSTIYEATPAELKDSNVHAGETLELSGKFVLPADQFPSGRDAYGKYSWINWKIRLDCKLAGAPDYNVTFPVEVQVPFADKSAPLEKQSNAQIQNPQS